MCDMRLHPKGVQDIKTEEITSVEYQGYFPWYTSIPVDALPGIYSIGMSGIGQYYWDDYDEIDNLFKWGHVTEEYFNEEKKECKYRFLFNGPQLCKDKVNYLIKNKNNKD